jgi:hypothetical protein
LYSSETIGTPLDELLSDVPLPLSPELDDGLQQLGVGEQFDEYLSFESIARYHRNFRNNFLETPERVLEAQLKRMRYLKKYNFFTNEDPLKRKELAEESKKRYATMQQRPLEGIPFSVVKTNHKVRQNMQ